MKLLYKHQSALFGTIQARRQGVRWVRTHPPKQVKCKIKNTDTVHNAPCVEERSTFIQNTPYFPLFLHPPISHFFTKTPPHFPHFYKKHPHFISCLRACYSVHHSSDEVSNQNKYVAGNYVFSCHTINNKSGNG